MSKDIHNDRILILDFGSQYTQLIARRVRELGVFSEVHSYDMDSDLIREFKPTGIILSGGPNTVTQGNTPRVPTIVFDLQCPVLGICYGMQAMAQQLGGEVIVSDHREYGYARIKVLQPCALLQNIEDHTDEDGAPLLDVWMSHGDRVTAIPVGFKLIASSANAPLAVMANEQINYYGVQFHPEVTHTHQGKRILQNFVHKICKCSNLWTAKNIIDDSIRFIRRQIGKDRVILGLSGGVDSAVTAALLHKAIGEQLTCVFIDTGLLRLDEATQVRNTFNKHFGVKLIEIAAGDIFFQALRGVTDPEDKRKVIGKLFIEAFEEQSSKLDGIKWLAQGTIYPDVIESAGCKTGKAALIKSHHNVGGLPETLKLSLLEPLRELFKDEVREIGLELGLPHDMVYRHPFPGPGLGVRILGEVKLEYAEILKRADAIFIQELRQSGWYEKVSQAFAVFLPVKSVGVMGDTRRYDYVIALRAVTTDDFMTAKWSPLPHDLLAKVADRIINEVSGISRVTYDISGKPPATIEWE